MSCGKSHEKYEGINVGTGDLVISFFVIVRRSDEEEPGVRVFYLYSNSLVFEFEMITRIACIRDRWLGGWFDCPAGCVCRTRIEPKKEMTF